MSELSRVTETAADLGAGQNEDNLAVIENAFDVLTRSVIDKEV